jgi:hypothetical protein
VLWRRTLDGVVVLMADDASEPVALRGPAAEIWELLAVPTSLADLTMALADEYGVAADQIRADVRGAVDDLSGLGALCCR